MLNGQVNLRDAIRHQIDFVSGGKPYKLIENPAVLLVRYGRSVSLKEYWFISPSDLGVGTWMRPA